MLRGLRKSFENRLILAGFVFGGAMLEIEDASPSASSDCSTTSASATGLPLEKRLGLRNKGGNSRA